MNRASTLRSPVLLHKTGPQVAQELHACIGCSECLLACPALAEPITIDVLNRETLSGSISPPVAQFARSCYQWGAVVAHCRGGLPPGPLVLLFYSNTHRNRGIVRFF